MLNSTSSAWCSATGGKSVSTPTPLMPAPVLTNCGNSSRIAEGLAFVAVHP